MLFIGCITLHKRLQVAQIAYGLVTTHLRLKVPVIMFASKVKKTKGCKINVNIIKGCQLIKMELICPHN